MDLVSWMRAEGIRDNGVVQSVNPFISATLTKNNSLDDSNQNFQVNLTAIKVNQ